MSIQILFGIALLLCFYANNSAQYRFDSWTTDNGLPQNSIRTILQTSDGFIWFTTLDGLVKFDGVKFTVFNKSNSKNLPGNRFINLFAEADDTLWISTEEQGLVRYRNSEFRTFTTADGLPSNQADKVQKDLDGSLLISTFTNLVRFRDERFSIEQTIETKKCQIYVSPSGVRWEIAVNGLRSINRDGKTTQYDLPFDAEDISPDRTYNDFSFVPMFEDRDGVLWFAAAGKLFRLKNGAVEAITVRDGMPNSRIHILAQDREGGIWLGTESDGACRFDEKRFICFGTNEGLSSNYVASFLADREGTFWIATNDNGINQATPRLIDSVSIAEGLANKNVYPILETSPGEFWIGTTTAVSVQKNGKITNYTRRDGLLYEIVQSLCKDRDGRLWIGSIGGVQFLENGRFTDFTEKLGVAIGENEFWDIHQDRAGVMWFATRKGLIRYDKGLTKIYTTADNLPGDNVKTIIENDDGSLWIGTYDGIALLKDEKFTVYTETDGLAGNHVRSMYKDETGALWIGTYDSGLSRFKNGKFTNFTMEQGLSSNGVFQILEDAGKNFWMSSNQGIYRVSRLQLDEFAEGKRQTVTSTIFGKTDGMLNIEANGGGQPAGIKASDGRLWFPTQDGAAVIDPEAVKINKLPPPVVIEAARIENQIVKKLGNKIELLPGQENLEIDYTGLSFIKPEQVNFRYKLEGLDENWTEAGNRRTAFYPHLAPGEYVFHVAAANSDNVRNEEGAKIAVIVKPYFYQTWYFLAISTTLILLTIYSIYRREIGRFQKAKSMQEEFSRRLINAHESERRRIAAELHDSIGQTLAMIKNRATFGGNINENKLEAQEQFDKITAQTKQAISEVREISYNLRPYLLDRLGLTKAIKSFVNKFEEVNFLKVETELGDVDNLLSKEFELNIYRIIQESLNNVAKHSEASRVFLRFVKIGANVIIEIEDDGRGFKKNAPSTIDSDKGGFGLLGISERVRMLGGTLEINSAVGKGTKISIKITTK